MMRADPLKVFLFFTINFNLSHYLKLIQIGLYGIRFLEHSQQLLIYWLIILTLYKLSFLIPHTSVYLYQTPLFLFLLLMCSIFLILYFFFSSHNLPKCRKIIVTSQSSPSSFLLVIIVPILLNFHFCQQIYLSCFSFFQTFFLHLSQ